MSDATGLCFTPALELTGLMRARKLSPVELLDAVLGRIDALDALPAGGGGLRGAEAVGAEPTAAADHGNAARRSAAVAGPSADH